MASTISVAFVDQIAVVETFSDASPANPDLTFNSQASSATYTAATAVPVAKHASFEKALSGGTGGIDLTTLPGKTVDETVNGTGLKLQFAKFTCKLTNANPITITKGATNGYGLESSATAWTVKLAPGQSVTLDLQEAAPDIAAGARAIDLAGTAAQVLQCRLVMG